MVITDFKQFVMGSLPSKSGSRSEHSIHPFLLINFFFCIQSSGFDRLLLTELDIPEQHNDIPQSISYDVRCNGCVMEP